MSRLAVLSNPAVLVTAIYGVIWFLVTADWFYVDLLPDIVVLTVALLGSGLSLAWVRWSRTQSGLVQAAVLTVAYVLCWQAAVLGTNYIAWDELRVNLARAGLFGFFLIGLAWAVWGIEQASQAYERKRIEAGIPELGRHGLHDVAPPNPHEPAGHRQRIWNPLDTAAWYYGKDSRKLNQSLTTLCSYTLAFVLCFLLLTQAGGCQEIYEMPAGGGEQKQIQQTVQIQKVIKKKFVINPFSNIIFNPPPIDEVKLQLSEVTAHMYNVGDGKGEGSGYSGGTNRGKVRFIRLEYAGGDWNQDFGVGADQNMLNEYHIRTKQKIHNETEARSVAQLKNFPMFKSPPMVYLTGQRNITISDSEKKILREYLLEKHGMIFGDNGGSRHFHNQFIAMMGQVLDHKVEPVQVPLDDVIHIIPYRIPFLPYVAPHGGKEALGWKVDGRWVCYYHPGDIGDAWSDGHAGVSREVTEFCYQLGTNVINYAHAEYNKWLDARQKTK